MTRGKGKEKKQMKAEESIGGIFRTVGSLLDILSDMVEKGEVEMRPEREVGLGKRKGMRAMYGFSMRLGREEQLRIEPFGNVRRERGKRALVEKVREPMVDVFDERKNVVVVAELPGIKGKGFTVKLLSCPKNRKSI